MPDGSSQIDQAVKILRNGGLVAFATETVYGLGADATQPAAVDRIYRAKGRPGTNPLIIHVANLETARRYASQWPKSAEILARQFWPGPLTLVVPKANSIVDNATAGLSTVGLRAPNHPLALELLGRFDGPVAAPSANRSNRISPTTAEHVRQELGDAVDLILDGGACEVGIESTVLSLVNEPTILRPGGISRHQIEAVIGRVTNKAEVIGPSQASLSPGQNAVHYAPSTPTYRFEENQRATVTAGPRDILIAITPAARFSLSMPDNPADYARQLYATLREADSGGFDRILIQLPPDDSQWQAVRDRLRRAARPI